MVTEGNACGAIRSLSGPKGTGRCFAPQEMRIATAFGLAMTVAVGSRYGFAKARWDLRCIPRNGTEAVPYS